MFSQVLVTATLLGPDATPAHGTVRLRLSGAMVDASTNRIIVPSDVVAVLDQTGRLSVLLVANNDQTTEPPDTTYAVYVQLAGAPEDRYRVVVDAASAAGVMDLADVEHLAL